MIKLVEVTTPKLSDTFIQSAKLLYKNDPEYIMPLDADIAQVFNPKINLTYNNGEAIRWILYDGEEPVGRVAAFYTFADAAKTEKAGGMGFFEVANNRDWAFMLFDACKNWLLSKQVTYMDGPINFGERDAFWGLMVSG
ncbi:MAG: hypothetical protein H7321_08150, partial [Bacteroidia bacterium]|nr:hypothetical protein [Bacteroidia bacterium]